ncbi:MAG: penicillin acylase family protein [Raineya sp.]|nr:penicillin acylase family protein [Raineya sp.]MDW8296343.1 penicillin acylase family protein [Raineya sp.]
MQVSLSEVTMRIFRAIIFLLWSASLTLALQFRLAEIPVLKNYLPEKLASAPPLGRFLDPFNGFWQNAEPKKRPTELKINAQALKDKVEIWLDSRLVPHIFAQNDYDLYFAQGYMIASERLWQMDFLTRFAAGRLSEVLGEKALEVDRSQRRMGILYSAQRTLANLKDSISKAVLQAYADGVNAYIASLQPHQYPLEFKILDYAPEQWSPLKSILMLKYMAYDLSIAYTDDFANSLAASMFGEKAIDSLFPNVPYRTEPVIPTKTPLDFKPLRKPQKPAKYDSISRALYQNLKELQSILQAQVTGEKVKGSNNWAIGAKKSETGFPILAGDPHLSLKLPSIWYEMQLISPTCNVYGVTLPGTPTIVIGFNEKIAWSLTNAYTDASDFYQIRFKDDKLDEYWHDNQWKKTLTRKEIIKVRGREKDEVDYIRYTHHGAIVLEKPAKLVPNEPNKLYSLEVPFRHALRWTAHDTTTNEVLAFYKLNRATNYKEFQESFVTFGYPTQVVAYADADKNIALQVIGKLPLRWSGQGKYILDGSNSAFEYQEFIPYAQNPKVLNPEQQFVASANQILVDTLTYPYYLGYEYVSPERAIRINERLRNTAKFKYEQVRELQNDVLGVHARELLPQMLLLLDTTQLSKEGQKIHQFLKKWDYLYKADAIGATCFEAWYEELKKAIWADELGSIAHYPAPDQMIRLVLKDTTSHWIDNKNTPEIKETLKMLLQTSFEKAVQTLQSKHQGNDENWTWARYKGFELKHLLIPNLGVKNLVTSGSKRTVNATSSDHGPSWRMIVLLGGNTPKAYGIYPGGQSGNPGSFYYDNMVENWRLGELEELIFLKNTQSRNPKILTRILMEKN